MIEKIVLRGEERAIIVRATFAESGITFVTSPDYPEQLAFMKHPAGMKISPHHHNRIDRTVSLTQEVLFIRRGRLRIDFFEAETYLESVVLNPGDVVLLTSGGHGFEALDDLEMFEVKQGPYVGEGEKTRFSGGSFEPVVKG